MTTLLFYSLFYVSVVGLVEVCALANRSSYCVVLYKNSEHISFTMCSAAYYQLVASGESKPECTGTPPKPKKAFRAPKMPEFSSERLIQVRSGAQCTKHYPTPYTYPLPVISD